MSADYDNEDSILEVLKWSPLILGFPFIWAYYWLGIIQSLVILAIEVWIVWRIVRWVNKNY